MERKLVRLLSLPFLILLMQIFLIKGQVLAAGPASIEVNPSAKSVQVGSPFSVNVVIDGGGSPFIVAEATVSVSSNLSIEKITLGDCYFAFIKTPTTTNPSFTGGIPGGSSQKCTVYSMELEPTSSGTGTVTISNGAVKSSVDASELLGSYQNGNYILTNSNSANITITPPVVVTAGPQNASIQTQTASPASYTLDIDVVDKDGKTGSGNLVILYDAADGTLVTTTKTDQNGHVSIPDVKGGTYNVVVADGTEKIAEQVITVGGSVAEMKFTVRGNTSAAQPETAAHTVRNLILSVVALVILAAITSGLIFYIKKRKNNPPPQSNPQPQTPPVPTQV